MERLDGGSAIPSALRGGIVALGNFDGVHRGHQAVVGAAVARARATGRPAIVCTFDPHPVRHFNPDAPPFQLTSLDQRLALFGEAGADAAVVLHFDAALSAMSAAAFAATYLAERLGAGHVVTGQDFTFGRGRSGNAQSLAALGTELGFTAEAVAPVADGAGVISSSRIRAALVEGDCEAAAAMLTRPYRIAGIVEHGDKRGRAIGYPTANLGLGDYQRPAYGIYAVRGRLGDGRVLGGVANLGIRPMFDPPRELLEPYFFDFSEELYGQRIEVDLISFIRPEARFEGLEALIRQIDADAAEARARLAAAPAAG